MKPALAAVLLALAAAAAGAQQSPIWNARLWLTGPAFGVEEDCPVAALFHDPPFRTIADGGAAAARLVSSRVDGDRLLLVIEDSAQKVTLELTLHRPEGIVSVDLIRQEGPGGQTRTLTYADAAADDDEYDEYTDTLVSLYRGWFDAKLVRDRVAEMPAQTPGSP